MKQTVEYIIDFLLGANFRRGAGVRVGYTADFRLFENFDVVIQDAGFFDENSYGKAETLPQLPLKIWEEVPILYGEPYCEMIGNTLVVHADIVASTYFLISRYEEMVRQELRDVHGRFPGKESLPYRAGFIDRPIVEEWGTQLRATMREYGMDIADEPHQISKVYMTHDVDQLTHFRSIRGMLGGLLRGIKRPKEGQKAMRSFLGRVTDDPWYTFPFLFKMNNFLKSKITAKRFETIVFVRTYGHRYPEDKPFPNLQHPDFKYLIRYCKRKAITIGLHASYECGIEPALIHAEKTKLEKLMHHAIRFNRNHFVNYREPHDMMLMIDAGITDDFGIGYADIAGFRLGTCRPVCYINPQTKKLYDLKLHALTIMDRTLSDKRYMYMNAHDAYQYCEQLINSVERYHGEIVFLWHNNLLEKTPNSYHRELYVDVIKYLSAK